MLEVLDANGQGHTNEQRAEVGVQARGKAPGHWLPPPALGQLSCRMVLLASRRYSPRQHIPDENNPQTRYYPFHIQLTSFPRASCKLLGFLLES